MFLLNFKLGEVENLSRTNPNKQGTKKHIMFWGEILWSYKHDRTSLECPINHILDSSWFSKINQPTSGQWTLLRITHDNTPLAKLWPCIKQVTINRRWCACASGSEAFTSQLSPGEVATAGLYPGTKHSLRVGSLNLKSLPLRGIMLVPKLGCIFSFLCQTTISGTPCPSVWWSSSWKRRKRRERD